MRRIAVLLFVLATFSTNALATWSVIAVDRKTGQVVIASATCVPQQAFAGFPAKGLKDVQAIILPGVGVAAAQANVDRTRRLQKLITDELNRGTDPARIIDMLKDEDANRYYLEIQVTDQDIRPDENDNPVKTLRTRYNSRVKDHARRGRSRSR